VNAADSLTNFNSSTDTLTGGAYNVTGTLEFAGANIVTNNASITLTGTKALIENFTNSANALAGFANNESGATFALATAAKFSTSGNSTNSGTLNIGTGSLFSTGTAGAADLTNYASNTLTGGTYIVTGTGQIQFNNEGTTGGVRRSRAGHGECFSSKASNPQRGIPCFHIEHARASCDSLARHTFRRSLCSDRTHAATIPSRQPRFPLVVMSCTQSHPLGQGSSRFTTT